MKIFDSLINILFIYLVVEENYSGNKDSSMVKLVFFMVKMTSEVSDLKKKKKCYDENIKGTWDMRRDNNGSKWSKAELW